MEPTLPSPAGTVETDTVTKSSPSIRLFHDENINSFFRRPSFSPDGLFLYLPTGEYARRTLTFSLVLH